MSILGKGDQFENEIGPAKIFAVGAVVLGMVAVFIGVLYDLADPIPDSRTSGDALPGQSHTLWDDRKILTALLPGDYRQQTRILINHLASADETLQAFLEAETVDQLLPLVADQKLVEQQIHAYYPGGRRQAIAAKARLDSSALIPGTDRKAFVFWVTVEGREIPVSVEETEAGFKIDWVAFTQFRDASFERFAAQPGSDGGRYYLQVRRSHYFANDIPDLEKLNVFRLQSPIAPSKDAYAFVRKDDPVGGQMLEKYRWGTGYRPVVELKWATPEGGGQPRIEIVQVVRDTWRR